MKMNNDKMHNVQGQSAILPNPMLGAVDFRQNDLFGKKVISSIGFDEQQIIRDILYLHGKGNYIDCDPTFSVGNFYKNGLPKPKYRFDKFPQTKDVIEATSDNLPLEDETCNIVMFDPPFVINGDLKETGIITKRFTSFKHWNELRAMYCGSLKEINRILKNGGLLIFKCQDIVSSGKNHFSHCWIMNEAVWLGFYPKDLFLLLAKNRLNDGREQQHARKYHSYFWVFEKTKCKVDYAGSFHCT